MKNGMLKVAAATPKIRVADCAHNAGQIMVAMLLLETAEIGYYLPVLCITGTVAGIFIGLVSSLLIRRIPVKES
jgi:heptaprenyl diphosphate synthase